MRLIGLAVILSLILAPLAAEAQQTGKVYRIGFLSAGSQPTSENRQAFEHALGERGWMLGENLIIAYPFAEGKYDRLPTLAAELVRLEPRVIVAVPTVAARAARDATTTIPIVMMFVSDPIAEGLIASLARPGGNVTGLTLTPTREIFAKQLQLLKEAIRARGGSHFSGIRPTRSRLGPQRSGSSRRRRGRSGSSCRSSARASPRNWSPPSGR